MAEFHFTKFTTRDGNTFQDVLEIFTKDWEVTEQTTTAFRTPADINSIEPTTKMEENENDR